MLLLRLAQRLKQHVPEVLVIWTKPDEESNGQISESKETRMMNKWWNPTSLITNPTSKSFWPAASNTQLGRLVGQRWNGGLLVLRC